MNIPSMRLYGKTRVQILSHKGLCGFSGDEIQILSAVGIICVCGKNLEITEINDEYISIKGRIDRIAYKD